MIWMLGSSIVIIADFCFYKTLGLAGGIAYSLPFAVLGLYSNSVLKTQKLDPLQKRIRFFGIGFGFILTIVYAIYEFWFSGKTGIGGFFIFSYLTLYIGGIIGALIYAIGYRVIKQFK